MIISSLNANFLKKFKSIKFKSVIMKITFLPSDYLINGLRNLVDIQKIESTFLLRAVRIVNDSSNTIRLKKYRFDHLIESEIVKSVIYEESMIRKKAEDIKLTLERLSHSDMAKLFMGQAELWNKEQFSTSELKQNQETGFRTEYFTYMGEKPIDQLKFTISYLENNKVCKEEITIPIKQYKCKNNYTFPLNGAWIPVNTSDNPYEHRRMHSQEFGFDLVKTDSNMKIIPDTGNQNNKIVYYGTEVLAIAEGLVVDIFESFPENPGAGELISQEQMQELFPITGYLPIAAGNYIVIEHQGEEFSFYAHLIPNSLKVKSGEKVKQGQVLGLLGNSGNSTAPHLHFQLMQGSDPLTARGLPCKFDNLTGLEGEKVEIVDKNFSIVYAE